MNDRHPLHEGHEACEEEERADEVARIMPAAPSIFAYEAGELDETETIELFQRLVNSGLAWKLQGSYGRTAMYLIEQGLVVMPSEDNPAAKTAY